METKSWACEGCGTAFDSYCEECKIEFCSIHSSHRGICNVDGYEGEITDGD